MSKLTDAPAWRAIVEHQREMAEVHMRDLFADDSPRFERFSLRLDDVLFDYSKNRITEETMTLLMDLARHARLSEWIAAMFGGEKINSTEVYCTLPCATDRIARFSWTGETSCPM